MIGAMKISAAAIAGAIAILSVQDRQPTAEVAKTEYEQLMVALKSDGTWEFESSEYNYFQRKLLPVKTLIPAGYVGWAVIRYGVRNALPLPIEGGSVIKRIPPSGELITSSLLEYGGDPPSPSRYEYYDYYRDRLTPIKMQWIGGWIGPPTVRLQDDERTVLAISTTKADDEEIVCRFFVGSAIDIQKYGDESGGRSIGSNVPLPEEPGSYAPPSAVSGLTLTSEDTLLAFNRAGRLVILKIDARNSRTWQYGGPEPAAIDESKMNTEIAASFREAISMLEDGRYDDFWRRFSNPYLSTDGTTHFRTQEGKMDCPQLLIDFMGREDYLQMSEKLAPDLAEIFDSIRDLRPVYERVEFSTNIRVRFLDSAGELQHQFYRTDGRWNLVRIG